VLLADSVPGVQQVLSSLLLELLLEDQKAACTYQFAMRPMHLILMVKNIRQKSHRCVECTQEQRSKSWSHPEAVRARSVKASLLMLSG